jgi:acyl dehydratase
MSTLYLEDIAPGHTYDSVEIAVTEDRIGRFEQAYGLAAADGSVSISHVASVTMRLITESGFRPAGGIMGSSIDDLLWPAPARPGDSLRIRSEVLEVRRSRTKPQLGVVRMRTETLNQHGETVQRMVANVIVPCRSPG